MNSIKMLGLVALAALAAMAFVGAGSATATTLCKENVGEGTCPAGQSVSLPETISAHAGSLTFSAGESKVSCPESSMTLNVEKSLGASKGLSGNVSSLSIPAAGCELWGGSSTGCLGGPEVLNSPYHAEIHEGAKGNGILTLSSGGTGNPTIRFKSCGSPHTGTCTYGAEKVELGFEGASSPQSIVASNERFNLVAGESSGCTAPPSTLDVSASYDFLGPEFGASTSEKANIADASNSPLILCGSSMSGSLSGTASSLTFSACEGLCNTGKALNLPYATKYVAKGPGEGTLTISSGGSGNPLFEFNSCVFGVEGAQASAASLVLDVSGGKIVASKEAMEGKAKKDPFGLLPKSLLWNATYSLSGTGAAVAPKP